MAERGRLWIENQAPDSRKGATIGWVRRYQAADGQLYAVLLSAYFILTMLPGVSRHRKLRLQGSDRTRRPDRAPLKLHGTTAELFSSVMRGAGEHKLSAVLIAIIDLFFFGLGFARVFELVQARSWGFDLRKSAIADEARYAEGSRRWSWARRAGRPGQAARGDPAWIGGLSTWSGSRCCSPSSSGARLLLHHRVATRDLLPGAVFTVLRLVILRAHLRLAAHALAELVLDDLRRVRDRHRDQLLDQPDRHDARPGRRSLAGAGASPQISARPERQAA